MKKLLIASFIGLFSISSLAYNVDTSKSKVTWKGSKVVGSTHVGHVKIKEADLKWEKDMPTAGKVVIDMTSITNTDLKDKKWNDKLVGHLKSDDFFGVDKHKTAILDIKNVKKKGDKKYELVGTLEIKGKKQPLKVTAEVMKATKSSKTVKANFKFDRTKFGIKYGSGKFFQDLGDKMISDDVEVSVDLHLAQSGA